MHNCLQGIFFFLQMENSKQQSYENLQGKKTWESLIVTVELNIFEGGLLAVVHFRDKTEPESDQEKETIEQIY